MKIQTVISFLLFVTLGLLCSCTENAKKSARDEVNIDDMKMDAMHKARGLYRTPDSLRSEEEKTLFRKIEAIMYEGVIVENDRFEIVIGRKEWMERGLPEIYYDMVEKDISDVNNFLDTTSFPAKPDFSSFLKAQEEHLAKKSQHPQ